MRVVVFLLVLANLLLYALSAGYFGRSGHEDAYRLSQQVNPERLRVVSRGEAPTDAETSRAKAGAADEPAATDSVADKPGAGDADQVAGKDSDKDSSKGDGARPDAGKDAAREPVREAPSKAAEKAADKAPVPRAPEKGADKSVAKAPEKESKEVAKPGASDKARLCLAWDELSDGEARTISDLLASKFPDFRVERKAGEAAVAQWWVFIPPLPSKVDSERKAGQLRALGVTDYFIVNDGAQRFAISLGIFTSEKRAEERLEDLKARGVRSAKVGERQGRDKGVALRAVGPLVQQAAVASALAALGKGEAQACK